jgi:hypothetical protein
MTAALIPILVLSVGLTAGILLGFGFRRKHAHVATPAIAVDAWRHSVRRGPRVLLRAPYHAYHATGTDLLRRS